jgi:hypothetical protein
MPSLILKRSPIGLNQEDYEVLEDSVVVGRIFLMPIGLKGRPWMWVIRDRTGARRHTAMRPLASRDGRVRQEPALS